MRKIASTIFVALISFSFFSFANSADKKLEKINSNEKELNFFTGMFDFRGVIYDVDFEFNSSEEWYRSIPKDVRPRKDQPFYHLLAENNEITYEAYVSEQNLVSDDSNEPIKHPLIEEIFTGKRGSGYFKQSN